MLNHVFFVRPGQDSEGIFRVQQADLLEPGDYSQFWWHHCDGNGLARASWSSEFLFKKNFKDYLHNPVVFYIR